LTFYRFIGLYLTTMSNFIEETIDGAENMYLEGDAFYYGDKYLLDGVWYHHRFPMAWAIDHVEGTGPVDCNNCACFGSVNDIFIGYCANCADYQYEGKRGRGFMGEGVEFSDESVMGFPSAFDTYLKGVDIAAIESIDDAHMDGTHDHDYDDEPNLDLRDYYENVEYDNDYHMNSDIINCSFEGGYNDM